MPPLTDDDLYAFGPFLLDPRARQLTRDGEIVPVPTRYFDVLLLLVTQPGQTHTKRALTDAGWKDQVVGDHSVEQALFMLRHTLILPSGESCLQTHPRRGYRFIAEVTRIKRRPSEESLDAIMLAHRAWIEGRAALHTLDSCAIVQARSVFERVVEQMPLQATAHVGLANACALQFEMTRTDAEPDVEAIKKALQHALEARQLNPQYGEAWATLGFVLERVGRRDDALAAARQSIVLEPDNWRHHLRLSAASWGEERLREARLTLQLLPGLPMAHWLAASVLVARGLLTPAEDELRLALDAREDEGRASPFGRVAVHWLLGLLLLARDARSEALDAFQRELDEEYCGHLYSKEVAANTWYAIGAARHHAGNSAGANKAFLECVRRVPTHLLARAAMGEPPPPMAQPGVEGALARAIYLCRESGGTTCQSALADFEVAFAGTAAGNAGWLLTMEPMLANRFDADTRRALIGKIRSRAA